MAISQNVETILKQKSEEFNIPYPIIYAIVGLETGGTFDINTIGDNGESFGLFQINKPSHPDFDITRYNNPSYQANYQLPELKRYYTQGMKQGLNGVELAKYVEQYGQRPVWTNAVASGIEKYYNEATGNSTDTSSSSSLVLADNSEPSQYDDSITGRVLGWLDGKVKSFNEGIFFVLFIIVAIIIFGISIYQIAK